MMIILVREEQEPGPDLVRVQAMPMQVVEQVQEEAAEPEVVVVPGVDPVQEQARVQVTV